MVFKKNHIPWNKGKHHSQATRDKISAIQSGKHQSKETVEKRRLKLLGKHPTQETKDKIALAERGKYVSEQTKKKQSLVKLGKHINPKTEFKNGHKTWNKGLRGIVKPTYSFPKGHTPWNKGMKNCFSEEALQKMRDFRAKQRLPIKNTSIERKLHEILDTIHIKYKKHYTVYHPKMGLHQVDIMLLDHEGKPALGIEADGCYFHGCSKHHPNSKFRKQSRKRDKVINECMKELGIELIRLWEHDIKAGRIPMDVYQH